MTEEKVNLLSLFRKTALEDPFLLSETPLLKSEEGIRSSSNIALDIVKTIREKRTTKDSKTKNNSIEIDTFISVKTQPSWHDVPWLRRELHQIHPNLRLHEEIIAFYKFIQPTDSEIETRNKILARISQDIKEFDGKLEINVFGSYASGFMLPGSDIDICIQDLRFQTRETQIDLLECIAELLTSRKTIVNLEKVFHARVPIIKFKDAEFGQKCDISINNNGHEAVGVVQKYSDRYPAFKFLLPILKLYLKQRGLNEVFNGGLSSYSLSLLLISHLQHHITNFANAVNQNSASKRKGRIKETLEKYPNEAISLGTLLVDFFALYGCHFNYKKLAIDVTKGGRYVVSENCLNSLRILDPTNLENNVSSGSRHFQTIFTSFSNAFYQLIDFGTAPTDAIANDFVIGGGELSSSSVTSSSVGMENDGTNNSRSDSEGGVSILSRIINITDDLRSRAILIAGEKKFKKRKLLF